MQELGKFNLKINVISNGLEKYMNLGITYKYMSDFEKFKEQFPSKEKFYSLLTSKKISDEEYKLFGTNLK